MIVQQAVNKKSRQQTTNKVTASHESDSPAHTYLHRFCCCLAASVDSPVGIQIYCIGQAHQYSAIESNYIVWYDGGTFLNSHSKFLTVKRVVFFGFLNIHQVFASYLLVICIQQSKARLQTGTNL